VEGLEPGIVASLYSFNAHLASYYAREVMMRYPNLYKFFETRDGNADVDLIVDGETWLDFKVRMQLQSERSAEATDMIVRELA